MTVETYAPRALEVKNVVVADTLLGTVPGATLAAFGPNNHVGILSLLFCESVKRIEEYYSTVVLFISCRVWTAKR